MRSGSDQFSCLWKRRVFVSGLRTGIWEWKHSIAPQSCCFAAFFPVSVLLFALWGVTGLLQLSVPVGFGVKSVGAQWALLKNSPKIRYQSLFPGVQNLLVHPILICHCPAGCLDGALMQWLNWISLSKIKYPLATCHCLEEK